MILLGSNFLGPATLAVPAVFRAEIQQTGALWLLLAIFAAAPLLSSSVEKGWLELTLLEGDFALADLSGPFSGWANALLFDLSAGDLSGGTAPVVENRSRAAAAWPSR